ncbi:MAG: hypothetical protein AAGE52_03345 [Myxococcota bacterium]
MILSFCLAGVVAAQPGLPWGDQAPSVTAEDVRCASLGQPDYRIDDWNARRLSARRHGESRARARLHRYVDDALARTQATPPIAQAVHRLVERASVTGVRPLADGSAVVVIAIPRSALRRAADLEGVPW